MTQYLSPKFSVGAPTSPKYGDNFDATFGHRLKPGDCPNCEGRGRLGEIECSSCEGTGRAAYGPQMPELPETPETD